MRTRDELTASLHAMQAASPHGEYCNPEFREIRACETCRHVRQVKIWLGSESHQGGQATWTKDCTACDYDKRADYKERTAADFRRRAAAIRRKRKTV